MKSMTDMMDLETNMAIHAYVRGLCSDSLLTINLTIKKVRTFLEIFFKAMLYIKVDELQESKKYRETEPYSDSQRNKRPHVKKRGTLIGRQCSIPPEHNETTT